MQELPYLTQDLPGVGGRIKSAPQDFVVEEIPLYLPSGQGQHIYLYLEKEGISTRQLVDDVARALGVSPRAIGFAGQKDARAVTRQYISVDGIDLARAQSLDLPRVKLIEAAAHRNKLKLGHLRGNRFTIRVRETTPDHQAAARSILDRLAQRGVPNYFGVQRFGMRSNNQRLGKTLLLGDSQDFVHEYLGRPLPEDSPDHHAARTAVEAGDYQAALDSWPPRLREERRVLEVLARSQGDTDQAMRALGKSMRRFAMSAFQSYLFNQMLSDRIQSLDRLENGDVAYIHASGAAFVVEYAELEQPRADNFEISPSGPLYGPKLLLAAGEPGQREQALLSQTGLTLDQFRLPGIKQKGARRPYRVPLTDIEIDWDEGLLLKFSLPPGSYATEVMRELMKSD